MASANVSTSWTGIPRDYREQERLRLEHELFRNISFNEEDDSKDLDFDPLLHHRVHVAGLAYDSNDDEEGDEYSIELPRNNPTQLSNDFTAPDLEIRYPGTLTEREEGETRSTTAHHANGVTFRTGLRGPSRRRRGSDADSAAEYDPDRQLDALLRGSTEFSILADSPNQGANRSTSRSQSQRSEFTKRAHGLGKQIDHEKSKRYLQSQPDNSTHLNDKRNRSYDISSTSAPLKSALRDTKPTAASKIAPVTAKNPYSTATYPYSARTPTRAWPAFDNKIQLPDVTGITAAVQTPAKGEASFKRPPVNAQLRPAKFPPTSILSERRVSQPAPEQDAVTAVALNDLAKKLKDIEKENATSRRRVTELELELEGCKEEVKREKTKLLDLSRDFAASQQQQANASNGRRTKAMNARVDAGDVSLQETERRYKEAVEEKRALEGLVKSLNTHLAQMSRKVQDHQDAISQLRTVREQDAKELREKCSEIESLRRDVEGLQGDVERLREVVEAGLQERKTARGQQESSVIVVDPTEVINILPEEHEEEDSLYANPLLNRPLRREPEVLSAVIEEDEPSSTRRSASAREGSRRFAKDSEIERVRQEIAERRSQRSMTASLSQDSGSEKSQGRLRSYAQGFQALAQPSSPAVNKNAQLQHTPPRPDSRAASEDADLHHHEEPVENVHRRRRQPSVREHEQEIHRVPSPTTLPQIRGERLERLFRAAPEHNEKTCGVCHRRKRSKHGGSRAEGLEYGSLPRNARSAKGRVEEREDAWASGDERHIEQAANRQGLPPQTVLARVLRELEDDFTHYKSIYVELADQYKAMDAASDASKRRLLANHLREVIDILEQKGDQISSLYDLLHFEDKPASSSAGLRR